MPFPPENNFRPQGTDDSSVDSDTDDSGVGLGPVNPDDTPQHIESESPDADQESFVIALLRQVLQEQDKIKESVANLEQGFLGEINSSKPNFRKLEPIPTQKSLPILKP